MAQPELEALRNFILQAKELLEPLHLPEARGIRAVELLRASLAIADDLLNTKPAATLGAKGGTVTAKRGKEYYSQIAAMRKTKGGGRPRKDSTE
jgi:hypothetical protein